MPPASETSAASGATPPWHALPHDAVLRQPAAGAGGLDADAPRERLARYGANRLRAPPRRPELLRLLAQFHNLLLYLMLGATVITAALGHWVDSAVLLAAVLRLPSDAQNESLFVNKTERLLHFISYFSFK